VVRVIGFNSFKLVGDQGFTHHDMVDAEGGKFPGIGIAKTPSRLPEGIPESFFYLSVGIGLRSIIEIAHDNDRVR